MNGHGDPGRVSGVAIIGLSGRFPDARNPSELWATLRAATRGRPHDVSGFDAAFFGMQAAAAGAIDLHHRLLLECAWEAFEHAGYVGELAQQPVGVFISPGARASAPDQHRRPTSGEGIVADLISRTLNLAGPSLDVRTAGASSLAAVHLACQSLLDGECDLALAGAAARLAHEDVDAAHRDGSWCSAGCVLLERLEDALDAGDQIHAVIRGSALNSGGARHERGAATSPSGQVRAVTEALAMAGVRPDEVSYVESIWPVTGANDAIGSLTTAFGAVTAERQFIALGSPTGPIVDAGDAAGITGLIKVVLALRHGLIPPNPYGGASQAGANLEDSPFYVETALRDWTVPPGRARIAGVAALGGGNAHACLIVEQAPARPPAAPSRTHQLLVLSARTPTALDMLTASLAAWLRDHGDASLADVAYTLLEGRTPWACRRAVTVRDAADAVGALESAASGHAITNILTRPEPPTVVWMCSGDEPYAGMSSGLSASEPVYRQALDEALDHLDADLEGAVRSLLHAGPLANAQRNDQRGEPSVTLPALVAVEYALGRLLQSWGVTPGALIGEGAGAYVAACFAGVFDIRDAMVLAAAEGRLLESLEAVPVPDTHTGPPAPSPLAGPRLEAFTHVCRTVASRAPATPVVSNTTGSWLTAREAADPAYWSNRPRQTTRLADGIRMLLAEPGATFVHVGPGQTLVNLLARQSNAPPAAIATLRAPDEPVADIAVLLTALGQLWTSGVPVEASKLFAGERRRRVELPVYPFERVRCDPEPGPKSTSPAGPLVSVPPLEDIERQLAAIWRDVLEVTHDGPDADFFDLGGHSIAAARLFGRIRDTWGVDLPLATLFDARNTATLAALLRDRLAGAPPQEGSGPEPARGIAGATPEASRALVMVQPGTGVPLFVVHGAAGNVINTMELARALGPQQAVYGLQAAGLDGVSLPGATIEEMARAYLAEVRTVQPHGPYLLAGYSGGGVIAFEMARRLDTAGDAIGVLAFIDTFHPQMPLPRIDARTRMHRLRHEGTSYVRDGLARIWKTLHDTRAGGQIDRHLAAGEPIPPALRELHLIRNFTRAAGRYNPAPWSGKALLFKAEQVDYYHRAGGPAYGWEKTVLGGVEIVPVPADHDSIMRGANATLIARRLARVMAEATAGGIRTGAGR